MNLSKTYLWCKLREMKILRQHRRVAAICRDLIAGWQAAPETAPLVPKKDLGTDRIIWQYWAQGYEAVPPVVRECLASVDRFAAGWTVIRLSDANLAEYLDLPDFVLEKRRNYSVAHFSDLLRLMLLQAYGGAWLDATVQLSGPIPKQYADGEFFVFRRDPAEPDRKYWSGTYAYYFGWAPGFRVNMLNSIIFSRKGGKTVSDLCSLLLRWWKEHDGLPDYFFFQILFDVYGAPSGMPLVSDTLPHYLQQSINDPSFSLMPRDEIPLRISMHKRTYK